MSPAGYWPQLRAAIEAGADSVYFGLKHFSARAKVGFSVEELPEAVRTLHARGVRGYLTFNTLVFENEMEEAAETIASVAQAGIDALIVQDPAILLLARAIAPSLELHASTQMSITDAAGVRFAQSLGVQRVTLARELSLAEVRRIALETDCPLEIFVHGALCVAFSGQCFSSEAWGGRSANRGQCAQACRLPYDLIVDSQPAPLGDARYLLSPGDLYTLDHVADIVESGAAALKIEGRYKDAEYVAVITSAWRKAVDAAWQGSASQPSRAEALQLEQAYSRGLGPWFLAGTDHQAVVRGRAPRHRGVLMGRVARIHVREIVIEPSGAHAIAPLKPGDGIVFDAADWRSPQEPEEGGRVYEVERVQGSSLALRFANNSIDISRIRPGDLIWRTADPSLADAARPYLNPATPLRRQKVDVAVTARAGEPVRTRWTVREHPGAAVDVESPHSAEKASRRALSPDLLEAQFGRLGATPYALGKIMLETDGACFVPASTLNELRRDAVSRLEALQTQSAAAEAPDPLATLSALRSRHKPLAASPSPAECFIHLLVRTPEQLDAALELSPASITLDYLDLYGLRPSIERVRAAGFPVRAASPRILKPGEIRIVDFLVSLNCPILVRSSGALETLHAKASRELIGDFSLNAANSLSAADYFDRGVSFLTPTHDLNAAQIEDLALRAGADRIEAIAYQHLPVFHTEHCVFCRFLSTGRSYRDCGRPCEKHRVELRDAAGRAHPLMADVGCRNTVFGAEAQDASPHLERWRSVGIRHFRLEFAHESANQVQRICRLFQDALARRISHERLGRELRYAAPGGTTEGSLLVPAGSAFPILNQPFEKTE
jgi:U32 family peptidase